MKFLLLSFCLFLSLMGRAQITFQRAYGGSGQDYANNVIQTRDGGYLLIGSTWNFTPDLKERIYAIKTNALGDTTWSAVIGNINAAGGVSKAVQMSDKGYLIYSTAHFQFLGSSTGCLVKLDSNGHMLWTKIISDKVTFADIEPIKGDNYIVLAPESKSTALLKLSNTMSSYWGQSYAFNSSLSSKLDFVQQTSDHGYILTGHISGGTSIPYSDAILLIKTDSIGFILWGKTFQTTSRIFMHSVNESPLGGYTLSGQQYSNTAEMSAFLIRTDTLGDTLFTRSFKGSSANTAASSFIQLSNGEYLVSGYTNSYGAGGTDGFLLKLKSNGDTLWTRSYGAAGNDYIYGLTLCKDGGYLLPGQTTSMGAGGGDQYLIKTDAMGFSGDCSTGHAPFVLTKDTFSILPTTWSTQFATYAPYDSILPLVRGVSAYTSCLANAVEEHLLPRSPVYVYPNPSQGHFQLSCAKRITRVEILDMSGRTITRLQIQAQEASIDLTILPPGMYFCEVYFEDGAKGVSKLLIE